MLFNSGTNEVIESIVGSFAVAKDHRENSARTGVREISAQGQTLFVKIYNRLNRWHPEVFAYRNWTARLGAFAPELIAAFNEGDVFGIITTAVPGRTVNEAGLDDEKKLIKIYNETGHLLRKMQGDKKTRSSVHRRRTEVRLEKQL